MVWALGKYDTASANVLNLLWIRIGASKAPFSLLPFAPLQCGNRSRAPTTHTRHPGHALVQKFSCGDHLVAGMNTSLYLLNLHTGVVPTHDDRNTMIHNSTAADSDDWPIGSAHMPHAIVRVTAPSIHLVTVPLRGWQTHPRLDQVHPTFVLANGGYFSVDQQPAWYPVSGHPGVSAESIFLLELETDRAITI